MPAPDYTIFAITDLSMSTAAENGDTSFLLPYSHGAIPSLRPGEDLHVEREIDPSYGFDGFLASIDILLCGRQTYDQVMHQAKGQWPYLRKRLIVFSATPLSEPVESNHHFDHYPPPLNSEHFAGTPLQLVRLLEQESLKQWKRELVWVMGGANVRGEMIKIGAVKRVELVMVPRIVKNGIPVWSFGSRGDFMDNRDVKMVYRDCRTYENGVVALSYELDLGR